MSTISGAGNVPGGLTRGFFRRFNRLFMLPAYRSGLGRLVSNPLTGYYLLVGTRGRRSGAVRWTPVAYAWLDGRVYVMAGWGPASSWYRNALDDPHVRLRLADRALSGLAGEVREPKEKARALRRILQNSGLMAFTESANPWRDGDAELLRNAERKPVMRISIAGRRAGPGRFDPGGSGWLLSLGVAAILTVIAVGPMAARRQERRIS